MSFPKEWITNTPPKRNDFRVVLSKATLRFYELILLGNMAVQGVSKYMNWRPQKFEYRYMGIWERNCFWYFLSLQGPRQRLGGLENHVLCLSLLTMFFETLCTRVQQDCVIQLVNVACYSDDLAGDDKPEVQPSSCAILLSLQPLCCNAYDCRERKLAIMLQIPWKKF